MYRFPHFTAVSMSGLHDFITGVTIDFLKIILFGHFNLPYLAAMTTMNLTQLNEGQTQMKLRSSGRYSWEEIPQMEGVHLPLEENPS